MSDLADDDRVGNGVQNASDVAIGERTIKVGWLANRFSAFRGIKLAVGPFRLQVTVLSVLAVIAGVIDTALLYVVARLALMLTDSQVDTVDANLGIFGKHQLTLEDMILTAGGMLVIVVVLNIPMAKLTGALCKATLLRSRRRILSAYLRSSWSHRSTHTEGHLQEYMMSYGSKNEGVILQMTTIIVMGWSILTIAVTAIVLAKVIALLGLVGLGAMALLLKPVARRVKASASRLASLNRDFSSTVAQTARVSQEITTFAVATAVAKDRARAAIPAGNAVARLRFLTKSTPILFQYGALAVLVGIIYALSRLELGDLTLIGPLVLLLVRALSNTKQLQNATQAVLQTAPYVEFLEAEIIRLNDHPTPEGTVDVTAFSTMKFEGVGYSYIEGQPVLSDVDLCIEPGDAVGVIGPSGGGKSTLSQLLVRLRPPTTGKITIGGVDLIDITGDSWAKVMAMVPQDNSLIRGSVADNIRFFRDDLSDDDVIEASKAAHLHNDILEQLPNGYATDIGPGARELSGGQRQRLGIARALVGKPQLLVLDEPTSALDRNSEELIRQTLEALRGSTTLIVVAHRPATLQVCNRVLRVEEGQIREVPRDSPFATIATDDEPATPAR